MAKPKKEKERKPLTEEAKAARRAAGKKGMEARWGHGEKTVQVRAYESDAVTLKGMAPRTADAIRELLGGGAARRPPCQTETE